MVYNIQRSPYMKIEGDEYQWKSFKVMERKGKQANEWPRQSTTIAPAIKPISNVPAVIAKRSQPRLAADMAPEELVADAPEAPFAAAEEPVLCVIYDFQDQ